MNIGDEKKSPYFIGIVVTADVVTLTSEPSEFRACGVTSEIIISRYWLITEMTVSSVLTNNRSQSVGMCFS